MSTALESTAAHGSISYGLLAPSRLKAILLGDSPSPAESAQVHQALTETPPYRLATLAREVGLSHEEFRRRFASLTGTSFDQESRWTPGGH